MDARVFSHSRQVNYGAVLHDSVGSFLARILDYIIGSNLSIMAETYTLRESLVWLINDNRDNVNIEQILKGWWMWFVLLMRIFLNLVNLLLIASSSPNNGLIGPYLGLDVRPIQLLICQLEKLSCFLAFLFSLFFQTFYVMLYVLMLLQVFSLNILDPKLFLRETCWSGLVWI